MRIGADRQVRTCPMGAFLVWKTPAARFYPLRGNGCIGGASAINGETLAEFRIAGDRKFRS